MGATKNPPDADLVLSRLDGGGLEALATVAVDHLLTQPVAALLDADWAAHQVVLALEAASAGPETAEWLRHQIAAARDRVPDGTLGDRVPDEVRGPLEEVVKRPYLPDRELVGRLLDHDAMRRLLRDVLVGALEGFVKKLKAAPVPGGARLSRLKAFGEKALGDGMLGGLSHEIERQAEARIRDFVDGAVHTFVEQVADHVTAQEHAQRYAEFRAHVVDTLLDTELAVFARELDKLHPDDLVATGAATAKALAHRAGFEAEMAAVIRAAIEATAGRSLGEILEEAGVREGWRSELEAQLVERARPLLATSSFQAWLAEILKPV